MAKKEEKLAIEKQRLEMKNKDQIKKIDKRMEAVNKILEIDPHCSEVLHVREKFQESYEKRKGFANELLKSRQNCTELKSKINKFVKQQNMLMIKLKSSTGKGVD